jgi:hypothetical protein
MRKGAQAHVHLQHARRMLSLGIQNVCGYTSTTYVYFHGVVMKHRKNFLL